MDRQPVRRYSRWKSAFTDDRSIQLVNLTKRMSKLRRAEQNLARILSSPEVSETEKRRARGDLDRTLSEIDQIAADIRKYEAEP